MSIMRATRVRDIMSPNVLTVKSGTTVREVSRLMVERRVGSVVVHDGSRVVGIVTDRDVLATITKKKNFNPDVEAVDRIMSK